MPMKENLLKPLQHRSNWKCLYNSLGIWVTIYLTLIALGVYEFSADHAFVPHHRSNSPSKNLNTSLISSTDDTLEANNQNSTNRSTLVTIKEEMQVVDKK